MDETRELAESGADDAPSDCPRARFYRVVFRSAGLRDELAEAVAEEAAADKHFAEQLVSGLVTDGIYQPRGEIYDRVTLEDLKGLPFPSAILNQLERMRLAAANPEEWARLGRLFHYSGQQERAALCHRTGFGLMEEASPEVLVSLAEGLAAELDKPLALGCIDRIAEIILTGDQALDNPDRLDLTSEDPAGCAVLLERTCRAAMRCGEPGRAASLARAATALFERCGLRHKLQQALETLAEALVALGDVDGAIRTIDRRRLVVSAESDYPRVAACYRRLAELGELEDDIDAAIRSYELEVQVRESILDLEQASEAARLQGQLCLRAGRLDDAIDAFERARELAADLDVERALAVLAMAEVWAAMGNLSTARRDLAIGADLLEATGEKGLAAEARLELAVVEAMVGATDAARASLIASSELEPAFEDEPAARLARALLILEDGRRDEGVRALRRAAHGAARSGDSEAAARALLLLGWLPGRLEPHERVGLVPLIDSLEAIHPEQEARLDILRARLEGARGRLQELFEGVAASEFTLLRLEAARALAEVAMAEGERQVATRGMASALRTLAEMLNRLDEADQELFSGALISVSLLRLAQELKQQLSAVGDTSDLDNDATARLSPAFIIDGLLASVSRSFGDRRPSTSTLLPQDAPADGRDAEAE